MSEAGIGASRQVPMNLQKNTRNANNAEPLASSAKEMGEYGISVKC